MERIACQRMKNMKQEYYELMLINNIIFLFPIGYLHLIQDVLNRFANLSLINILLKSFNGIIGYIILRSSDFQLKISLLSRNNRNTFTEAFFLQLKYVKVIRTYNYYYYFETMNKNILKYIYVRKILPITVISHNRIQLRQTGYLNATNRLAVKF